MARIPVIFDPASLVEDWSNVDAMGVPCATGWGQAWADGYGSTATDAPLGGNALSLRGVNVEVGEDIVTAYAHASPRFFFDLTQPMTATFNVRLIGAGNQYLGGLANGSYGSSAALFGVANQGSATTRRVYDSATGYSQEAWASEPSTIRFGRPRIWGLQDMELESQNADGSIAAAAATSTVYGITVTHDPAGANGWPVAEYEVGTGKLTYDSYFARRALAGTSPPQIYSYGYGSGHTWAVASRYWWPFSLTFGNGDVDVGPITFTGRRIWGACDALGWLSEWDLQVDGGPPSWGAWLSDPHFYDLGGLSPGTGAVLDMLGGAVPANTSFHAHGPDLFPAAGWHFDKLWWNAPLGKANPSRLSLCVRYSDDDSLVPDSIIPGNSGNLIGSVPYRDPGFSAPDKGYWNDVQGEFPLDQVVGLDGIPYGRAVYLDVAGSSGASPVVASAQPRLGGVWVSFTDVDYGLPLRDSATNAITPIRHTATGTILAIRRSL